MRLGEHRQHLFYELRAAMLEPDERLVKVRAFVRRGHRDRRQRLVIVGQGSEDLEGVLQAHHADVAVWC